MLKEPGSVWLHSLQILHICTNRRISIPTETADTRLKNDNTSLGPARTHDYPARGGNSLIHFGHTKTFPLQKGLYNQTEGGTAVKNQNLHSQRKTDVYNGWNKTTRLRPDQIWSHNYIADRLHPDSWHGAYA